jgi:small GTP-binding protein
VSVRREGAAQVALVGPPNAGKSSLLQALSSIQIKTGDYAFTTTRPVPALTRIGGVLVQLVEIPGLIAGANEDRGGGRALLGVLRGADAIVFCHAAGAPPEELRVVLDEVRLAGIERPALVAATKVDEAGQGAVERLATTFPGFDFVGVTVLDDASLDAFRERVWGLTGLMRVYLGRGGEPDGDPLALRPPVTVADAARDIHNEVAERARGARVWGPSARFPGQRVGLAHELLDGDVVEVIAAR